MERLTATHRRCGLVAALVLTLAVFGSLVADKAAAGSSQSRGGWGYLVHLSIDHHLTWTSPGAVVNTNCRWMAAVVPVPLEKHGSFRLTGQSSKPAFANSYIGAPLPRKIKPGYVQVLGGGGFVTWALDIHAVDIKRLSQIPGCREPDYAQPTDGCGKIPNLFPRAPQGIRWGFAYNSLLDPQDRFPRDQIGFFLPTGSYRANGAMCPGPTPPFGNVRWDKTSGPVSPRTFTQKRKFVIRHTDSRTFSCSRCADGVRVDQGAIVYTLKSEWSLSFQPCKTRGLANGNVKCGGYIFGPGGRPPRPGSPPRR